MADKNFLIKNGLTVGSTERISSAGVITGSLSGSLASATTATTQSASDNSTKIATTAYTDAAITALVDSSPGALNTLNELAAALGDDASFSTTVTNSIATKAPLATPQFTNRVGIGVAAHGTAALNITSTAQHMRLNNGSELGIISLLSTGELELWGHGDSESINFRTGTGTGTIAMNVVGNNVGIGNPAPYFPLHVQGATGFNGEAKNNILAFDTTSATTGTGGGIAFGGYTNGTGGDVYHFGNIQGIKENSTAGNVASAMLFSTRAAGATPVEQMRISSTGNVGIGTDNPLRALHIGNANHILFERGGELRSKDSSGNEKTLVRINGSNELEYGWSGAGPVKFMGGGSYTERMRVHTNSNIGIGEINPDRQLHVKSGTTNVVAKFESTDQIAALEFTDSGGSAEIGCDGSDVVLFPAGAEKFRVQNSTGYLIAQSASQVRLVLGSTGNSSNNTSNWIRGTGSELGFNSAGGNTSFEVNGTLKMRIRSDGGVAIGNNNAGYSSQILSVNSAAADNVFYGESTDAKCIMSVRDGDSTTNVGFGATGNAHVFSQDGTEIARFSSGSADKYPTSGNGGIGGAGSNLHLAGDDSEIRMANQIIHADNSGLTKFTIRNAYGYHSTGAELSLDSGYISLNTGTSYTERMRILSNGVLLFHTTTQSGISNGTSNISCGSLGSGQLVLATNNDTPVILNRALGSGNMITFRNNGGTIGSISQNGSVMTYGGTSDYRLKENVADMTNATTRLKQLKPKKFNYISDTTNTLYDGFLAHEVAAVVPDAVVGTKDAMTAQVLYTEGDELPDGKSVGDVKEASVPDYQMLDNSKLVPLLVKTVQEQQTIIEDLKARIETLEAKVKALEDA